MLDGVLFFPVTPLTATGVLDVELLAQLVAKGVEAGPGGVFIGCGTGEFHALDPEEMRTVVRTAVEVVAGRVPVYAGAGRFHRVGQGLRRGGRQKPARTGYCCSRRISWRFAAGGPRGVHA